MGLNWTAEIISWFSDDWPIYWYDLIDFINGTQGIMIALSFTWTNKVKRLLLQRLGCKVVKKNQRYNSSQKKIWEQ